MPGFWSRSVKAIPVFNVDDDGNPTSAGGGGGGGGGAVTVANGADAAEGNTTDTAYTDRTGVAAGTVISVLKGLFTGIVGNAASGTTDSGNPVKVGGVVNTTSPTALTTGQRGDLWLTAQGAVVVSGTITAGADAVANSSVISLAQLAGSGLRLTANSSWVFNGTTWDRMRGDTNGTYMVSKGSAGIATAQAAVTTAAAQIVAARAGRGSVKITNLGTSDIYLGVSGVSTTTGDLLVGTKGASVTIPTNAAIFAIGAAAGSVSILEVF